MKVLDPQSALLTTAEVHHFLLTHPPRNPDKKIGAYASVNLTDLNQVRKDFTEYVDRTAPHVKAYPPPEKWMKDVVGRLREFGLTKAEALQVVDLGLGVRREMGGSGDGGGEGRGKANGEVQEGEGEGKERGDGVAAMGDTMEEGEELGEEEVDEDSGHRALLGCIVEDFDERFAGDDGEEKVQGILSVLTECMKERKDG